MIVVYNLVLIVLSLIVIYSNQPKVTGDFNDTIEDVKEAARLMRKEQSTMCVEDVRMDLARV